MIELFIVVCFIWAGAMTWRQLQLARRVGVLERERRR